MQQMRPPAGVRLICFGEFLAAYRLAELTEVLRDALITYGNYSPIGTRQEKMLHPIMQEIINMTTHARPLSVGLPLYPFSLESAFQYGERAEKKAAAEAGGLLDIGGEEDDVGEAIAPIPDASYGPDILMEDQQGQSIVIPSLQGLGGGWQNVG